MNDTEKKLALSTILIHGGEISPRIAGAVVSPIFQTSTYDYASDFSSYHDIRYLRLNNSPNHNLLHRKLALLEDGEAAIVSASGMAAITSALLTVLRPGDHLLAQRCLYGATHTFIREDLAALGISSTFIDATDPSSWEKHRRPQTRAIFVEAMTNPLLEVAAHREIVTFAQAYQLVSLIDNTFASPVNFQPLKLGYDLSLHSATKYLNGHSDIVAGVAIGRKTYIDRITRTLNHLGATLDPHACFLLQRGLKTLSLRMACHNSNTLKLAHYLEEHPSVAVVYYPGLKSSPHYARGREYFDGCSGILSFRLHDGLRAAEKMISNLKIPIHAPSLGSVESLISLPASTTHRQIADEEKNGLGISRDLIRLAVGIEDYNDVQNDFAAALGQV